MMLFGSAYPVGKILLNTSLPPFLFASLRMGILFVILVTIWGIRVPERKYWAPLVGFSFSMGVGVYMFMNLALQNSSLVSPIIIGSQLAIPFGIIISTLFLKESLPLSKWLWIVSAFAGIVLIAFTPKVGDEIYGLFLAGVMSFFYGLAQVFSRHLKHMPVTQTNAWMGLTGFIVLLLLSVFTEGDTVQHLAAMNISTWFLVLYTSVVISLIAHMSLFYLYKYYSVGQIFPFYSLFPVFGLLQTYLIFDETMSLLFTIGSIVVLGSIFMLNKRKKLTT